MRTREASTRDSKEAHMLLQQLVDHQVNIYPNSSTGQRGGGGEIVSISVRMNKLSLAREGLDARFSLLSDTTSSTACGYIDSTGGDETHGLTFFFFF